MRPIGKDFRLNNRDETMLLANGCVSCETPGILINGLLGGAPFFNFQYSSPFGESTPERIELFGHGRQSIQALSVVFATLVKKSNSLVNFDPGDDSF